MLSQNGKGLFPVDDKTANTLILAGQYRNSLEHPAVYHGQHTSDPGGPYVLRSLARWDSNDLAIHMIVLLLVGKSDFRRFIPASESAKNSSAYYN
jgi:hypothetical protein